jgi:hypothetical protein
MNVASEVLLTVRCMKYKCHHITSNDWHRWCSEVQLYWCFTPALHGNEQSVPCSGHFSPEVRASLPAVEAAMLISVPIRTGWEISTTAGIRTPEITAGCESLCRLNYRAFLNYMMPNNYCAVYCWLYFV